MKKIFFVFLFTIAAFGSLKAQVVDCKDLPDSFRTYESAIRAIESAKFVIKEYNESFTSSWIRSISYYSCDKKEGFLIIETHENRKYIHRNVPINKWKGFKAVKSKGRYYLNQIKGKYMFDLSE